MSVQALGDSATREERSYGAMATEQAMMNGVSQGLRHQAPPAQQDSSVMENPNTGDVATLGDGAGSRDVPDGLFRLPQSTTAEPPYEGITASGRERYKHGTEQGNYGETGRCYPYQFCYEGSRVLHVALR